ncbi:hypothetical protein EYR41_007849 [Orbilia oligospora]|uniref:ubiquitinyl hydrolase 1 n=1 Tax=Orbilia oligospora TaxID=2813651 RepID=A0A7C8TTZ5_ORBOL|nr:hypothetical protein TWF751_010890 [Orbilia oligospora]TGJ66199.1 hypothetical protein EYR41_007849 [Orbilia oligospora]
MSMRKRRLTIAPGDDEAGPSRRPRISNVRSTEGTGSGPGSRSSPSQPPSINTGTRGSGSTQTSFMVDSSMPSEEDPSEMLSLQKPLFDPLIIDVFFPPRLPDKALEKSVQKEADHFLLTLLAQAADDFGEALTLQQHPWWKSVQKNLTTLVRLYKPDEEQAWLSKEKLIDALTGMETGDFITLYIRKQNAGIVIRKKEEEAIFESFEASCLADAVSECRRRLRCSFPGPSIATKLSTFEDERFIDSLSEYLSFTDGSAADNTDGKGGTINDAGATNPSFITHLLTNIIRGVGRPDNARESKICKRVGDSVLGAESSVWRRSPLWLVVRVGLQSTLKLETRHQVDWYKCFQVYFMSKILRKALDQDLVTQDILYIMGAKIARRRQKLSGTVPEFIGSEIASTVELLSKKLHRRWKQFYNFNVKQISWSPGSLEVAADCKLKLATSGDYLASVMDGETSLTSSELTQRPFIPGKYFRITDPLSLKEGLLKAELLNTPKKDLAVLLMDIESWVDTGIDAYATLYQRRLEDPDFQQSQKDAVIQLGQLFNDYFRVAIQEYEGNPENLSVAFLTGFEIWVAMDKIATSCTPLLARYHPEIQGKHLNNLVLPSRRQMERLAAIQTHIMDRAVKATVSKPTIFKDKFFEASFACLYFDQEPYLQDLLESVREAANAARREMCSNLKEINHQYHSIMMEYHRMDHELTPTGRHRTQKKCPKCLKENEAKSLTVGIHEWPLPDKDEEDDALTKTIIFELDCPKHFVAWRDTTFRMLINTSAILQFSETHPETRAQEKLSTYIGLRDFYKDERTAGVILASQRKATGRLGGVKVDLPAEEDQILVPFSFRPRYWYGDTASGHWVSDFFRLKGTWDKRMFSYKLPNSSVYKPLQFSLRRSDHTSNEILALQNKCHPRLSLHEFYEYGTLRAGHRLQWMNIAKALKARSLSLDKKEVSFLILQASWEAGPVVRGTKHMFLRDNHRSFDKTSVILDILDVIEHIVASIKTNWREIVIATTIIALTCRCLALIKKDQQAAITQASGLVLKLREMVYGWIEQLREKIKLEQEEDRLAEKLQHLMHCAATCRMTYEVPTKRARDLIDGLVPGEDLDGRCDPKHISIYLETAAIIRDNLPARREHVEDYFRHAIDRSNRLSHRWETRVRDFVLHDPAPIDLAVEKQWQPHMRQGNWEAADAPNEHWLRAITRPVLGERDVQVSLNLLDGQILIDSIPFGRLPQEYVSHPTYDRIFGSEILTVGPSSLNGMQFETRFPIEGHSVHFALKGESLIIRSQKERTIYELVPHTLFGGDLCNSLIDDYTHWLDQNGSTIQFRKLRSKWDTQNYEWKLFLRDNGPTLSRLEDSRVLVVDPNSNTANQVNQILGCLEEKSYILITATHNEQREKIILADLARLNLRFLSKDDNFVCRNFSGFIVDEDQDIGCLHGLANKLVLRKGDERMALIPFGDILLKRYDDFTQVSVNRAESYQAYTVDKRLGRLVGNGSITSRLYQLYLHAVTSSPSCQVDILTGRTGTEEAASLLASGAVKSFQELDKVDIQLLHLIAHLTPHRARSISRRDTRKENERNAAKNARIETVVWEDHLSFNCQRDIFRVGATQVIEYWMKAKKFLETDKISAEDLIQNDEQDEGDAAIETGKEDKRTEEGVKRGDELLLRRAAYRNEIFYAFLENTWGDVRDGETYLEDNDEDIDMLVSRAGPAPIEDMSYTARDGTIEDEEDKGPQVCHLVRLLLKWKTGMGPPNLWGAFSSYTVTGVKGSNSSVKLQMNDALLRRSAGEIWCALFQLCRNASRRDDTFKLIFTLGTLMYRDGFDPGMVHALAAAAILPAFRDEQFEIPSGHYDINQGYQPAPKELEKVIKGFTRPFETSRFYGIAANPHESVQGANSRRRTAYNEESGFQRLTLKQHYEDQWETARPVRPANARRFNLVELEDAHNAITKYFAKISRVSKLKKAIDKIQNFLTNHLDEDASAQPIYVFSTFREIKRRDKEPVTVEDIMENVSAPVLDSVRDTPTTFTKSGLSAAENVQVVQPTLRLTQLQSLFRNLNGPRCSHFQKVYAEDLKQSVEALKAFQGNNGSRDLPLTLDTIREHALQWEEHVHILENTIRTRLEPIYFGNRIRTVEGQETLYHAGLWPRITIFSLLRRLSRHTMEIPEGWKRAIVGYGTALRELGRAKRLVNLATRGEVQSFWEALADTDTPRWDPMDMPEWLLLELENNFCMRDVQAEIAKEMISPSSGSSSVMQLNMGEGKSSVIIPAVATTLADGTKLVRVVVLKPLSREMFNLLRSKLGGLCSRRIYFLPFSRGLDITVRDAQSIKSIYEECMADGGILLVQNEHLLSFKLLRLEKICMEEDEPYIGPGLHETQKWLDKNARDLLDESDEILRANHTLVYTVGTQQPMNNQPYRWLDLLKVFDVVKKQALELQPRFPQGFEIESKSANGFPYLRILQPKAAEALTKAVVADLLFSDHPDRQWFATVTPERRKMISKFVTDKEFPEEDIAELKQTLRGGHMFAAALLFRGLFAYDIMRFCLQEKRWRVDYGADFDRTLLAVPFKAKDTPSIASDFAHPEVLLCLTCLSWYNYGLNWGEIKDCIEAVSSVDNPEDEYSRWIEDNKDLPGHLKSLQGVNLDNPDDFESLLCPALELNKKVIDFYLQTFVFPRFSKQFPYKLTSSGWDVVEKKANLTSGFSGTNDNKYLLPLSIRQKDLDTHKHTNALVLNYLLATENNHFVRSSKPRTREKLPVLELLDSIVMQNPPISVILDVGAQVLELNNEEVAREWLSRASRADSERWQAAIFFNPKDEICVVDLSGRVELLMTSNFAKQMETCLCYLDDAHTRGTDLQFPLGSRALITLGPKTTKDRLVQGAMRMRKLGKGHSVVFCAPPDVEAQILAISNGKSKVENVDVLKWALRETCKQTKRNAELWAAQGVNYAQRLMARTDYERMAEWNVLRKLLFEQEKMSLADLYDLKASPNESYIDKMTRLNIASHPIVTEIIGHCRIFDIQNFDALTGELDEEQEREVEQEVEKQRQTELPPPARPLLHDLHKDIVKFVQTGNLPKKSKAVEPAITSLRRTSIKEQIRPGSWSTKLLVSQDFAHTVEISTNLEGGRQIDYQDNFVRPVSFILSCVKGNVKKKITLLIISPFEANGLLDKIKASPYVHLHVYMPRVTKSMPSFEDLRWMNVGKTYNRSWSLPSALLDQLNLFAGQLYFRHATAYHHTAEWLSLRTPELHPTSEWFEDGFVPPGHRQRRDGEAFKSTFKTSPVPCMQGLVAIRRKGMKSGLTQLGLLLDGKLIHADQFDEADEDVEKIWGEDAVSADESDTADYIKEEVEPLVRSAAATLRAQQQAYTPMEVDEQDGVDGVQPEAAGEAGEDYDDGSTDDGLPPNIKAESGEESDNDIDQSVFYRDSTPIAPTEDGDNETREDGTEIQW